MGVAAIISPTLQVVPVRTRRQQRQFLQLPWQIYHDDPHWVPPIRMVQRQLVGYAPHPFHENATCQTFLALKGGAAYGRIAAIVNHAHNEAHPDEQRGFVGFFESIDDLRVAHGLFDAARKWLAAQGMHAMRGPVNPSLNYECGLLVENFEMPPTFMMTYNRPYYGALWESYGFRGVQDLYTYTGFKSDLEKLEKKVQFVAEEAARRFGVRVRHLNRHRFFDDVKTFLQIYNQSLVGVWGHVPMSPGEVAHMARSLRYLIVPEAVLIAEVDGRPVGSMLGLLDYNPRIKAIDGRLLPWGFIRLLRRKNQLRRVRLLSTNVLPEYQRWGVGVILAYNALGPGLRFGMEEGEFSWVLESNHLSRKTLERGQLLREKVHRIYDHDAAQQ